MTDEPTTDETLDRAALDAWAPLAPPADFADRVIAARGATPRVKRARWPFVVAALATSAAAGAVAFVALRDPSHAASGEVLAASSRTTTSLGDRAVAVAEPHATFAWRIDDDGVAAIEQREGDVFYRVDRGGPFVVHTPAGDVRVTGTCFRIEVSPMNKTQQLLLSGSIGAAVAAGIVVTVYEGHVFADSKTGGHAEIVAGNRATIGSDGRTVIAATDAPDSGSAAIVTATREQLITRATQQQNEIARLETKLAALEHASTGGPRNEGPEPGRAWYDPSPERLAIWASECHVRVDEPGVDRWEPMTSLGKNDRGLEQSELSPMNAAIAEVQARWKALVKALYIEATGDVAGAESLSLEAMRREIEEKGTNEDDTVLQRIAQERAGQRPPPTDLSKTSPFERMFRAYTELGAETEKAIAKRLGAERAKAIRGDAWGSQHDTAGCPDKD